AELPKPSAIEAELFPTKTKKHLDKARDKKYALAGWGIVLLIVGVAVVLTYLYYQSLQKPTTYDTNTTTTSRTKNTETITTMVYDRGVGADAAASAVGAITAAGIKAEKGADSSIAYDSSYIFYNPTYATQANTINTILTSYKFQMKESPLPGISVYLGKN
ncbi:MAG TPA: hypothetical protein VMQ44_02605, partial [Candidatus Saccharimonadales bacterium]|nr:hypothetical protein [Candidatus Saccharimonadales bacterium]